MKEERTLRGRKTSLCQGTKDPGVLSTVFKDVKRDAMSRADAKSRGKRQRAV